MPPNGRRPLLVILHAIQVRLGSAETAAIPVIAAELKLSRADLHGVVTFYRYFEARTGTEGDP